MKDVFVGVLIGFLIALFLEIFRSFDKKLVAALTLVAIAFIYVGFAWTDLFALSIAGAGALAFTALAYFGYTHQFNFILAGFVAHGLWDLLYSLFSPTAPLGYDKFCLTVDFILALYFWFKTRKAR